MKGRDIMYERWQNQEEALQFSLQHPSCMLDMDMGTGKTRVAIDAIFAREDVDRVLVVCPKAVVPVWRTNLEKFAPNDDWDVWDTQKGTIKIKARDMAEWVRVSDARKSICVVNYDVVWRSPMGEIIPMLDFDMVILDESHRAKSAGSKVSKYLGMLGKLVDYKMCLSGTPMANSPLDVYGQYRFLDPTIYGTNHNRFLQEYAIMGGPERRFIVGYKNQQELKEKFQSIAYSCKMSDVSARLKLPEVLPPVERVCTLPKKDMGTSKMLSKEFVAECESGAVVAANNVLVKMLRLQQITSGFCIVQDDPLSDERMEELNTVKEDELVDILHDLSDSEQLVVFCVFQHDLDAIARAADKAGRESCELSGRRNELEEWKTTVGAVLAVQIQAGAEGVDMTCANHAVYFSLPHSLALYDQSKARLYRPGQTRPVSFIHLIATGTVDEIMYNSLIKKRNIIEGIKDGTIDFGLLK